MEKKVKQFENNEDDVPNELSQRTDELYDVENASGQTLDEFTSPAIILQGIIIFPKMVSPVFINPGKNLSAIKEAQKNKKTLVGLIPLPGKTEPKKIMDFLPIGIEIAIGRLLKIHDGNYSALMQGRKRVQILDIKENEPYIQVSAKPIDETVEINKDTKAAMKITRRLFEQCVNLDRSLPEEANMYTRNIEDPAWLADLIATAISPDLDTRTELLQLTNPVIRLNNVKSLLKEEIDVLKLQESIQGKVQNEVDRNQREFYLREQIKAIQGELGEGDIWERDIQDYRNRVKLKKLPEEVRSVLNKELERLSQTPPMSPEVGIMRSYIEWILDLPWTEESTDNLNVVHAQRILDADHYGLSKAKERIIEFIAVRNLTKGRTHEPILCFVGPPGTGKTSFGKSIAKAIGRNFVRVSLGGVRDEAEIRGHRRTYVGALPGRILQTMKRAGISNPLFMLDEIDKIGADFRGDPSAALLEVLDPEQNSNFSDHYLEISYDLSRVIFITTANSIENLPPALLDRMEIIEFPAYTEEEKIKIAQKFLFPKQVRECGLTSAGISIESKALQKIISEYTYEAGVRNLEREINKVLRKIARVNAEGIQTPPKISPADLEKYLGAPRFFPFEVEKQDEVGVAMAIAWTEGGGEIMPVEVLKMEGKGTLQVTGQIGEIMQESAQAALSYVKSIAKEFQIDPEIFEKVDIHIHIPEGSIPKDGPSAGVTIGAALVSAMSNRKIDRNVGMTGEITLRGRVLPVGGIKEKLLAAQRAGLKKVILPKKNEKDVQDIKPSTLKKMQIIYVENMRDILKLVLN